MRPVSAGLVGSSTARAVHGWSFGADCVLLNDAVDTGPAADAGRAASDADTAPAEVLAQACQPDTVSTVCTLSGLADQAESGSGPMVIADADLRLALPGYLDLVDVPGDATAALLANPYDIEAPRQRMAGVHDATLARVGRDGAAIESSGSSRHRVSDPNRVLVGLLRVSATDRPRAARLWRDASQSDTAAHTGADSATLFDRALLGLVRGGLRVGNQPVGCYSWTRRHVVVSGTAGTKWQQRLRSASRLGDGAYSTAVIRPLSRLVTRLSLRLNLAPNVLTLISLMIGVGTAVLIMTGTTWGWIAAAFGLQLALIIDCSDGEVARFTRRFSAFGGWLDGIGDRVKEYLVFAALAAVAARGDATSGWLLAMIAMAVVTARHLEDYAYHDRNVDERASVVVPHRLDASTDGGSGRQVLPVPASSATRRRFWLKRIAHVPIAERYVILSIGLLVGKPTWTLVAAIAVSGFALCWTFGGRLVAALRDRAAISSKSQVSGSAGASDPSRDSSTRWGTLDHQLDLGVLARVLARGTAAFVPATIIMAGLWIVITVSIWLGPGRVSSLVALASAMVMIPVLAVSWRPPLRHPLGWLTLPLMWLAEAAVMIAMVRFAEHRLGLEALIFITLAVVCYRRYELIYSIRLLGLPQRRIGVLGAEGRILLVTLTAVLASWLPAGGWAVRQVTGWGMVAVAAVTVTEAILSTLVRWQILTSDRIAEKNGQPR